MIRSRSFRRLPPVLTTIVALLPAAAQAFNPTTGDYSKGNPLDVRIMAYNTEGNFIADASRDAAFNRIFVAIKPDVISLEEIPSALSASTMAARFNTILPIGG